MKGDPVVHCATCGALCKPYGLATGYAVRRDSGDKICYKCAAIEEIQSMRETGRGTLYLTKHEGKWVVQNWPGTLKYPAVVKEGRHNWRHCVVQYVWFNGPDGFVWYGRHVNGPVSGSIVRVQRTRKRA